MNHPNNDSGLCKRCRICDRPLTVTYSLARGYCTRCQLRARLRDVPVDRLAALAPLAVEVIRDEPVSAPTAAKRVIHRCVERTGDCAPVTGLHGFTPGAPVAPGDPRHHYHGRGAAGALPILRRAARPAVCDQAHRRYHIARADEAIRGGLFMTAPAASAGPRAAGRRQQEHEVLDFSERWNR